MKPTLLIALLALFLLGSPDRPAHGTCWSPSRVEVLPVFFVPQGGVNPVQAQKADLMQYLYWAQTRYFEMMKDRSTFAIADSVPMVYTGIHSDSFYRSQLDGGASVYADELLTHLGYNRFSCPYVLLVIYMSPWTSFPGGGGRPINAGFNTGGGIVILSSYDLSYTPNFESTLQHELGHSFGLPHVDVYGYDMSSNASIMSYNPAHHTSFFRPSATPGILIPEDLRDLALNRLVFPDMYFDRTIDVPAGYNLFPEIVWLGIFDIPNQTSYRLSASTTSGEISGSHVANIVQHQIKPSTAGMGNTFDPHNMWQSGVVTWAEAEIHFPVAVTLDKIGVHSQHSGQYHQADSVRVQTYSNGSYALVSLQDLSGIDQYVSFSAASDSVWKFSFRSGASGSVVIRGVEFFLEDEPLFPPLVPYTVTTPFLSELPSRPALGDPPDGFVTTSPVVDLDWTCSQALDYRLQVGVDRDFCSPLTNAVVSSSNYVFAIPAGNTDYYWRVKGRNDAGHGFGEWSEIRKFSAGEIAAGEAVDVASRIVLYPNPNAGSFTVRNRFSHGSSSPGAAEVRIVNVSGEVVYAEKLAGSPEYRVQPGLAAGVYFVTVSDAEGQCSRKMVVR